MTIRREGHRILGFLLIISLALIFLVHTYWPAGQTAVSIVALGFFLLVLQFFRSPNRVIPELNNNLVYAPADGRVVVVENTMEGEYFKEERIQLSIFMSPLNVHVNRHPVSGTVDYYKYHPGKYLVAWHPKSSTENERSTVVVDTGKAKLLIRQIAGAVARRISTYVDKGQEVKQGADMGFISFGSRVDVFLPTSAKVNVKIGDTVKGNIDVLAELS